MFGQGSFNVSQNPNPGTAGPPFSALSADNGLSVDAVSGRIVIGQSVGAAGDPGQLLSNREVPLKGFSFTLGEAGSSHFIVNPAGAYLLGDLSGLGNGSNVGVVDASKQLRFNSGGAIYFDISAGIGSYRMGDVSTIANGSVFSINDATQYIEIVTGGNPYFVIDQPNTYYALGDVNNFLDPVFELGIGAGVQPFAATSLQVGGSAMTAQETLSIQGGFLPIWSARLDDGVTIAEMKFTNNGLSIMGDTTMIHTATSWANGAAAAAGTLNNAPAAGNPTKWIPVDDNGTTRYIPAW
jgi:hypothetical protein